MNALALHWLSGNGSTYVYMLLFIQTCVNAWGAPVRLCVFVCGLLFTAEPGLQWPAVCELILTV